MDSKSHSFLISLTLSNMLWNNFSNGLSETREAIADGYFWDSESVETRLLPWVRLAKYNEIREWTVWSGLNKKVIGMVTLGANGSKDYFVFMQNGDMSRYQVSNAGSYLWVTGSFPLGGTITDIVETPRWVYAFWEQSALWSTAITCKIYYIAKTVVSNAETLDYGLMLTNPERITFTHNTTNINHFYGKKYATLVDNQALMWTARAADGKVAIYMMDYESLIPLVSQPGTIVDYLPWTCTGISSQGWFVYVYMQDKVYYYAIGDLLNGVATTLVPTGVINVAFNIYDVVAGDTTDWVMTSNWLYQRSGITFTMMSGQVFGTFNGTLWSSPLIQAYSRGNDVPWNKITSYWRKNNFFKGGFVWSEYVNGDEDSVFWNGQLYSYFDGSTKLKLVQKGNTLGWTVDAPWYFPLTENRELGIFAPSGTINSCRFYAPSFQTKKVIKDINISFNLNWGTIALDMRSNANTTFTQIGSWTAGWINDTKNWAMIHENQLPNRQVQWVEYRVRITRGADTTTTPIFYWLIPTYEEMTEEF